MVAHLDSPPQLAPQWPALQRWAPPPQSNTHKHQHCNQPTGATGFEKANENTHTQIYTGAVLGLESLYLSLSISLTHTHSHGRRTHSGRHNTKRGTCRQNKQHTQRVTYRSSHGVASQAQDKEDPHSHLQSLRRKRPTTLKGTVGSRLVPSDSIWAKTYWNTLKLLRALQQRGPSG